MKREKRRLRLAKRQALLAEVSQRAAMRGLADALAEEARSAGLAKRSRALVADYSGRATSSDGDALRHTVAFTGALAAIAKDADAAKADAAQQSAWQAQELGFAQTRARRQSERLHDALAAYNEARDARQSDHSTMPSSRDRARLARPVQCDEADLQTANTLSPRTAT